MLHKIRAVMGLRNDCYQLGGEVELDEGFFETVCTTRDKDEHLSAEEVVKDKQLFL